MAREHNDANVLALGGRILDPELAIEIITVFMTTEFRQDEPRHTRRINKIDIQHSP
tara:strand:+ start:144 stop:311 length:168 start_codon:yes stop_codon:yes gene_type:complete